MFDLLSASSDTLWKFVNAAWIVSLLAWLCLRSRSSHLVLSRLWRMAQGKPQRTDPIVARWLDQRDALVQFRVMAGAPVRTLDNAHRLIAWAEAHNEDVADIARCDRNFDLEAIAPKKTPSRLEFAFAAGVLCLSIPTFVISATATLAPRAWVSVRQPDAQTLYLSLTDVRVWGSAHHFGAAQCDSMAPAALAAEVELSKNEVTTACGWLKDPKLPEYLDKTLITQRLGLAWVALLGGGYAWLGRRWLSSVRAARDMAKRLAARAASTASVTPAPASASSPPKDATAPPSSP